MFFCGISKHILLNSFHKKKSLMQFQLPSNRLKKINFWLDNRILVFQCLHWAVTCFAMLRFMLREWLGVFCVSRPRVPIRTLRFIFFFASRLVCVRGRVTCEHNGDELVGEQLDNNAIIISSQSERARANAFNWESRPSQNAAEPSRECAFCAR